MSLRALVFSILRPCFFATALYGQPVSLTEISWAESLGNNTLQHISRIKPAINGGAWLLNGPNNYAGPTAPSQLTRLNADGKPIGPSRTIQNVFGTDGAVILDFAESANGDKYAIILTDESPVPTVIVGVRIFLAKFDANWNPSWVKSLSQPGSITAIGFRLLVSDDGWAFVYGVLQTDHTLSCFRPDGELAWSKAEFTGAQGLGLVILSGDIVLSSDGSKVLFSTYFEPGNRFKLRLYDRNSGQLTAAKDFLNINITSTIATPDGGFWATGRPNASLSECLIIKIDAALTLTSAWVCTEPQARANSMLLWADDTTFVALIDGFQRSVILRASQSGRLLKGVQYRSFSEITPVRADVLRREDSFWLTASLRPASSAKSALLRMDTTLTLPECMGTPWCGLLRAASLTESPVSPSFGGVSVSDTDAVFVWDQGLAAASRAYCDDTPELVGVSALFSLQDTICAGASIRPDLLQNGGASTAFWDFSSGFPASFVGLNPPEVRFEVPGKYAIRQIAVSECFLDTFVRELTVLGRPQIVLPPSQDFCKDTAIAIIPLLTNATNWAWNDGWLGLNRVIGNSGIYRLEADNQGYCSTNQTLELNFIRLDAAFELPEQTCRLNPLTLRLPPQPPGSQWAWQINPPVPNWPSGAAAIDLLWPSAEEYAITLSLENKTCKQFQTLTIEVLESPTVRIGPDFRLKEGAQRIIRPALSPQNADYFWQDGAPEFNRIITDTGTYILSAEFGLCRASDTLRVLPEVRVYQPNIFKPGSAENGFFRVYPGIGVQLERLDIFDRWGSLIFSGQGADAAWDGLVKNRPAEIGVYVYVAYLRLAEGDQIKVDGDITLIR